jgi:benzoyl-CoA reductase/2-hydroxyglutaryl-CoA dehydratase subunit BcrC/BadD/HgdB
MLYTQLFLKEKLAKSNLMKITLKKVKKIIKVTNLSKNEFKNIGLAYAVFTRPMIAEL